MKRLSLLLVALLAVMALVIVAACSDDDGTPTGPGAPTTGSVQGTVNFVGTWPATGEVQVSIYSGLNNPPWVPMGAPDGFTDPVAGDPASYSYTISGLDFATYSAIYVSWRDPLNPMGATLIGMYWTNPDSVGVALDSGSGFVLPVEEPSDVTLSVSDHEKTNLTIKADLDLIP